MEEEEEELEEEEGETHQPWMREPGRNSRRLKIEKRMTFVFSTKRFVCPRPGDGAPEQFQEGLQWGFGMGLRRAPAGLQKRLQRIPNEALGWAPDRLQRAPSGLQRGSGRGFGKTSREV